jgi:hypothetical protein
MSAPLDLTKPAEGEPTVSEPADFNISVLWSVSQPCPAGKVIAFEVVSEDRKFNEDGSVHRSDYVIRMVSSD